MNKRITIKQIAAALHVSISTVSKALNDSYEISDETKKKIQDYAKEHKYKPNTLALSLQNKKTKTIGILLPNILTYYYARVLRGIEKVATEKGYNLITCITNESYKKELYTMEMLSNGTIDGFIACVSEETLQLEKFDHFIFCLARKFQPFPVFVVPCRLTFEFFNKIFSDPVIIISLWI